MIKRNWKRCRFTIQKNDYIFGMWYCINKRLLCIGGPKKYEQEFVKLSEHFKCTLLQRRLHSDNQRLKLIFSCTGLAFISGKGLADKEFFIEKVDRFKRIMN